MAASALGHQAYLMNRSTPRTPVSVEMKDMTKSSEQVRSIAKIDAKVPLLIDQIANFVSDFFR